MKWLAVLEIALELVERHVLLEAVHINVTPVDVVEIVLITAQARVLIVAPKIVVQVHV